MYGNEDWWASLHHTSKRITRYRFFYHILPYSGHQPILKDYVRDGFKVAGADILLDISTSEYHRLIDLLLSSTSQVCSGQQNYVLW